MWEGPDGAWGIGWLVAWDSPADAAEFEARFEELKPTVGGPVALSYLKQDVLQVLIASDQAMLEDLGAAVGE